jgi:hypothetical protein
MGVCDSESFNSDATKGTQMLQVPMFWHASSADCPGSELHSSDGFSTVTNADRQEARHLMANLRFPYGICCENAVRSVERG